jgi:hypothetical protein
MDISVLFKLVVLLLWPFLLLFLYYLFDSKGFKRRWESLKKRFY